MRANDQRARMVGHTEDCWCPHCRRPSDAGSRRRKRVALGRRVEKRAIKRGERQRAMRAAREETER